MYDCTHPAKKFKQDSTNLYQVRSFVAKHSPHRLTTLNRMVDKMNATMHRNFRVCSPYAQEKNNAATKLLDTLLIHLRDVDHCKQIT